MFKVKQNLCIVILSGILGVTAVYSSDDMDKYYEGGGKSFNPGNAEIHNNTKNHIKTQRIKYDDARKQYYFGEAPPIHTQENINKDNPIRESDSSVKYNLQKYKQGAHDILVDEYKKENHFLYGSMFGLFTGGSINFLFSLYKNKGVLPRKIFVPRPFLFSALACGVFGGLLETIYRKMPHPYNPEDILRPGFDRRTRVLDNQVDQWPWRVHGQLQMHYIHKDGSGKETVYIGSGTLIKDKYVLTAAHNLYDHTLGAPDSIIFLPGKSHDNVPWCSNAKNFTIHPEYKKAMTHQKRKEYDMGVVELEDPLGSELGYFGFNYFDDNLTKNASITGYPAIPDHGKYMYTMNGDIIASTQNRVYYDIDTYGGQSGSGVYFNPLEDTYVCVAAHGYGRDPKWFFERKRLDHQYNSGTKITKDNLDLLKKWMDE